MEWSRRMAMFDANFFSEKIIGAYRQDPEGFLNEIESSNHLRWMQISREIPDELVEILDRILERRPDVRLRIFNYCGRLNVNCDMLKQLPHLQKLELEVNFPGETFQPDFSAVITLPKLRTLWLNAFNLKDYSFLRHVSPQLEELSVSADTYSGGVLFDCAWLKDFPELRSLYLTHKARKHIEAVAELPKLKDFGMRAIKLPSLEFLKPLGLESFALEWCSMSDLSSLAALNTLRKLTLFHILKLEDISCISGLVNLEFLLLGQLKHIKTLPDLRRLDKLRKISLWDMKIEEAALPPEVRKLVSYTD